MITANGQKQLLKLVSGKTDRFADLFAVGISSAALPTTATNLDFGWATCPVTDSYVDEQLNQVVFHGTLPQNVVGQIRELGLVAQTDDFIANGLPNSLSYTFEPNELWFSDMDYEITNTGAVGTNNYRLNNAAADSYLARIVSRVDVNRYNRMKIILNTTAITKIKVLLKNDEQNYAHKDFTLANGENILESDIASFTKVGAFNPNEIFEIRFQILTRSSATNNIEFDSMIMYSLENGGLVARSTLSVVQYKRAGASMELEYAVAL